MKWFIVVLLILLDTYVVHNKKVEDGIKVGYYIVSTLIGLFVLFLT